MKNNNLHQEKVPKKSKENFLKEIEKQTKEDIAWGLCEK